jgi:membrane fusion protein (multidrug efflux system)
MRNVWKTGFITITGILLCGLFLGGCQNKKEGGPPSFMNGTPEVGVVTLTSQRVALVTELPGRATAHLVAEIRPQVGGIVTKRAFVEGADVKVGDLLYEIDPRSYQASYDNAKAVLAKAEANLLPTRIKAERYKDLIAIKGVSQQDYDDALASLKQAEAEIQAAEAALQTALINLQDTKVRAPISGRIGKSNITVGALVTANQASALATIQQLDPIYIDATQSSAKLLKLKRDLSAGRMRKSSGRTGLRETAPRGRLGISP